MSDEFVIMKKMCRFHYYAPFNPDKEATTEKIIIHYSMKHFYKTEINDSGKLSINENTGHFNNFISMFVNNFKNRITIIGPKI